jgi:inosine-uridine nucleoside N-ribohydrolase
LWADGRTAKTKLGGCAFSLIFVDTKNHIERRRRYYDDDDCTDDDDTTTMRIEDDTTTTMNNMRVWIDADPSGLVLTGLDCDDDLAILAALAVPNLDIAGFSVCGGNAPLQHTAPNFDLLLQYVYGAASSTSAASTSTASTTARENFKVHRGIGWQSMNSGWKTLAFFHWLTPDWPDSDDAAWAIINAAKNSPPRSLSVLSLGPPSNLARALELAPWLATHLKQAVLMGGEMTNQRLDLNFCSDRAAARAVIESNLPTTLVPIQTCAQTAVTFKLLQAFETKCCPTAAACAWLPKMKMQVLVMPHLVNRAAAKRFPPCTSGTSSTRRWTPSSFLRNGFIPWDVVALLALVQPDLFDQWEWHRAELPPCGTEGEPCDRTMTILPLSNTRTGSGGGAADADETTLLLAYSPEETTNDYRGIVRVPHLVKNETQLLEFAFMDLMCHLAPAHQTAAGMPMNNEAQQTPPFLWGFLAHIIALLCGSITVVLTTVILLVWFVLRRKRSRQKTKQE